MLSILLATLPHDVQKENAALACVNEIFECGSKQIRHRAAWKRRLFFHDFSSRVSSKVALLHLARAGAQALDLGQG
jgi:hypothetical protein